MTAKHMGSCLCGAVRFEISGDFERFFLCHCSRCRKSTGSAHASNLFSTTAALEWLSGEDKIRTYQVPSTRFTKHFCDECGAALPGVRQGGAYIVAPAGSLDSEVALRPVAHIFCASRANWDEALEAVPMLDGTPA